MPATPVISVIIPCYNHAHFLRDAVFSVSSTSRTVEVIVVDDGSTDGTLEVADACTRGMRNGIPVRVFHQSNAGVSAARNRGFAESRGDYVVFLDADDRLTPDALDAGARALDAHPQCAFVYGRCQTMLADGSLLPTPIQTRIEQHHYRELLRRNHLWMPAMVMFRRQPLERAGVFNSLVRFTAAYELYLRIARTYPVHDHGQLVAHYRRHEAGSSADTGAMLRETLMVLRSQRPYVDGEAEELAAFREGWRNWQQYYGDQLMMEIRADVRAGRVLAAFRKAIVMGVLHPRGLAQHAKRKLQVTTREAPMIRRARL